MLPTVVAAFFALWLPQHIGAANILGIFPLPSISHQKLPRVLMKALAERGHNVTFFTTDPLETSLANLEQHSWREMYEVFRQVNFAELKETDLGPVGFINQVWPIMMHQTDLEMKYPAVAELLASQRTYDVVIVEALGMTPFYAFAKHFKAPLIGITTLEAPDMSHSAVGNFIHPVVYPNFMLPYAENLNFVQRLHAVYVDLYFRAYTWLYINPEFDKIIEQHFGVDMTKSAELVKSLDFLMYNSHPVFGTVRPTVPASLTLGFVHIEPTKPLPMDLEAYFRQSRKGVIYFSLGSNVRSSDLSPARVKIICDVFRKLDYNILWKWETDELNNRPENVKIIKWAPQQEILAQKQVKLFITQGGQQSFEEAIHKAVPLLVIPFMADQFLNAQRVERMGVGHKLDINVLTAASFEQTLQRILTNESYKVNAKKYSELAKDQQITSLENAVWWTEYVIRHKGAKHLHAKDKDMPIYQFYMLDIGAFVLVALLLCLWAIGRIVDFLKSQFEHLDKQRKKSKIK